MPTLPITLLTAENVSKMFSPLKLRSYFPFLDGFDMFPKSPKVPKGRGRTVVYTKQPKGLYGLDSKGVLHVASVDSTGVRRWVKVPKDAHIPHTTRTRYYGSTAKKPKSKKTVKKTKSKKTVKKTKSKKTVKKTKYKKTVKKTKSKKTVKKTKSKKTVRKTKSAMTRKRCPNGRIKNPATGRCVLKSGAIGQAL
jgi:hypothetical protein